MICTQISISAGLCNPEEFSFTMDENPPEQTLMVKKLDTLKRKQQIYKKCKENCISYYCMVCMLITLNALPLRLFARRRKYMCLVQ